MLDNFFYVLVSDSRDHINSSVSHCVCVLSSLTHNCTISLYSQYGTGKNKKFTAREIWAGIPTTTDLPAYKNSLGLRFLILKTDCRDVYLSKFCED